MSKDTKTQARVASAVRKFKAEAATGQAQEGFQQRIEVLFRSRICFNVGLVLRDVFIFALNDRPT